MKIVQINSFFNGSTGKIMMAIHQELINQGYESYVIWGRGGNKKIKNGLYLNSKFGVYMHALYARLTGKNGFASSFVTKKLIKKLKKLKPDIIHLHNIHGYYINIDILFKYLRQNNIKVVWTLHDCWAFTGQCSHFLFVKCNKWKNECYNCPIIDRYPKSYVDNSKWNYQRKKELFTNQNITIVTPSKWLSNLVKKSFLKEYKVEVINNGIDTSTFYYLKSKDLTKYNIPNDKKIILGVASTWDKRKGLDDFIKLSKLLNGEKYQLVLVGLNEKQLRKLPLNIIGIKRTESKEDLVKLYSAACILFNPTYEDNYPTVDLESISCGTPVFAYDVGGVKETIIDDYGKLVDFNDFVKNIDNYSSYERKNKILVKSEQEMANEYMNLYKKI